MHSWRAGVTSKNKTLMWRNLSHFRTEIIEVNLLCIAGKLIIDGQKFTDVVCEIKSLNQKNVMPKKINTS